jgi:YidC/Oxa1 family membrane protein insertase
MEKRFVVAFALSILILLGWSLVSKRFFPPPEQPSAVEGPAPGAAAPVLPATPPAENAGTASPSGGAQPTPPLPEAVGYAAGN